MALSAQVREITLSCECGNKGCVAKVTITDTWHARLSGNMYTRVCATGHIPTILVHKRIIASGEGYKIWQ